MELTLNTGFYEATEVLFNKGMDIKIHGYNALVHAIKQDAFALVKYLVEKGVPVKDIKADSIKDRVLKEYILEKQAKLPRRKEKKNTSDREKKKLGNELISAAGHGEIDKVKKLVEDGVDIHYNSDLALQTAVSAIHFDVVKYLVEKGADIYAYYNYAFKVSTSPRIAQYLKKLDEQKENKIANNKINI